MKFPSIRDVAHDLRVINKDVESECDVRLQVYPDGEWAIRYGLSDYDQDHRGYWGASSVPGSGKRFDSMFVAQDLLDQAQEHHALSEDDDEVS